MVAMLQKSEQQHRQRMREMKCLYDIGKASGDSNSIDEFLGKAVTLIPQATQYPEETRVRITFHDQVFKSPNFQKIPEQSGGKPGRQRRGDRHSGNIFQPDNPYLKKKNHLTKTLAERIGERYPPAGAGTIAPRLLRTAGKRGG